MHKVFIIAEVGVNHNGEVETAFKLVDAASETGADAVKFQIFRPEDVASRFADKAEYQKKTTGSGSQLNMLKKLALSFTDFKKLHLHCEKRNIIIDTVGGLKGHEDG